MYMKRFLPVPCRIIGLIIHFHEFEIYIQGERKTSPVAYHKVNEILLTMTPSGERALPQKLH